MSTTISSIAASASTYQADSKAVSEKKPAESANTPGSAASFSQGSDTFVAATHANDSFTPAAFTSGFYSVGSAASFTQGTDTFVAAKLSSGFYSVGSAASFTQGVDSFTAATHAADSFTAASLLSGFYTAGSAASLSYTSRSIPNITSVGSLPSLSISSVAVVNDISKV